MPAGSVVLGGLHSVVCAQSAGDQPWRCLWRGSEQITMTRPCRRITLHLSQIGLTLGFTFTAVSILFCLLVGCFGRALLVAVHKCGPGTGRRETAPPPPGPRAGC